MKKKLIVAAGTVVLVLVIVLGCVLFWNSRREEQPPEISAVVVSSRLEQVSELATARYYYTNMGVFEDSNDFYGIKIPFTTKRFIVSYDGTILAGVDLAVADVVITDTALTVRLPEHPNGTAVVIAPGGGYARVVIDKESEEYAEHWLNPAGVTAFILHYRMPSDPHNSNRTDVMLEDGQRAMRIVRAHAKEWGIDPNKIGIMGSSAGGHLASSINAEYDHEFYKHVDASDDVSAKPDFAILCYPVITMQDKWAHNGTKKRLLGMNPTQEEKDRYSSELYVTKNTSPSFIVLAEDDDVVPSMNGVLYFQALRANGVMNSEIHVFRRGGHGFGIERIADDNALGMWPKLATNWLQGIGMLPKVTK